jgi:hypothetical protein
MMMPGRRCRLEGKACEQSCAEDCQSYFSHDRFSSVLARYREAGREMRHASANSDQRAKRSISGFHEAASKFTGQRLISAKVSAAGLPFRMDGGATIRFNAGVSMQAWSVRCERQ